jgi:hypothetical protein
VYADTCTEGFGECRLADAHPESVLAFDVGAFSEGAEPANVRLELNVFIST